MFKVSNLTVYSMYNNNKIYLLKDICFSLDKGDRLGIIGKSGSGKSTLAKALLQIYDNSVFLEKGKIILNNELFYKEMRGKRISLLFQNPNSYLNPLMKVGKQIEEMLVYHLKKDKFTAKRETISFMKKMGMENAETIYNYYPYEISGGMQQIVCLCICLICKPDVLILDESTSSLDKELKVKILKLIKDLQKEYKFILIMISHDLEEIFSMCNKIAIMRCGGMIEFGLKDEIILNPIHPYTLEILCDYLCYCDDGDLFTCPLMKIELLQEANFTMISNTHYVRSFYLDENALKVELPKNMQVIKEKLYEHLNNF